MGGIDFASLSHVKAKINIIYFFIFFLFLSLIPPCVRRCVVVVVIVIAVVVDVYARVSCAGCVVCISIGE